MAQPVQLVELRRIRPNRLNPRLEVNIERLNELADIGFPVAEVSAFFSCQPFYGPAHRLMLLAESGLTKRIGGNSCIPNRRKARLDADEVVVVNHESIKLVFGFLYTRVVH